MKANLIILILFISMKNAAQAQTLASEKPVESYYSKTVRESLRQHKDRQAAARIARQQLPSEQAAPQASVPARIQPVKKEVKRSTTTGQPKLASEKPVLLPNVHVKKGAGSALSQ